MEIRQRNAESPGQPWNKIYQGPFDKVAPSVLEFLRAALSPGIEPLRTAMINGLLNREGRRNRLKTLRQVKRIVVAVIGGTVLLLGVALVFLPGPAFLVIPAGLAILATEFAWAKNWMDKVKGLFGKKPESLAGK